MFMNFLPYVVHLYQIDTLSNQFIFYGGVLLHIHFPYVNKYKISWESICFSISKQELNI